MNNNVHKRPIYCDYMATTPVDPRVVTQMLRFLGPEGVFGNPASTTHSYGREALEAVDRARDQVARSIGAKPEDIVFTSGATEADNLAIIGAARFYARKGKHLITMMTEHKAVLDSFQQLEREGFEVTYLKPQADGLLNLDTLAEALRLDTILVSIMQVNNEIGVVQDIAGIAKLLRNKGIIFHVDAAQSAGKIPIDLSELSVDLMSFSAHKNYGPKGIGALFVRQKPRIRLEALSFGGGHERGMRSGTLPTHQIVGMGEAFALAHENMAEEQARILEYRSQLWQGIKDLPGIQFNGHMTARVAGNLSLSFKGLDSESIFQALSALAISRTSACASASGQPSHVLRAMGLSNELAYSSIRLSLGRFTKAEEVSFMIELINREIGRLQKIKL